MCCKGDCLADVFFIQFSFWLEKNLSRTSLRNLRDAILNQFVSRNFEVSAIHDFRAHISLKYNLQNVQGLSYDSFSILLLKA